MATPKDNKGYKRSWKNLLLNKRYQLQFTLFMVGLSAVLMAGLGLWVMKEANETTAVSKSKVIGEACPKIPLLTETPTGADDDSDVPMKLDGEPSEAPDGSDAAGSAAGSAGSAVAPVAAGSAVAGEPVVPPVAAPAVPAPKMTHSAVDPKDVAKHNAMDDVNTVARLWCGEGVCKPGRAEPLAVKVAKCDAYVKQKLEDPAAVEALRKALIPVVKCEGGASFTVADAAEPEHHVKVQIDESSMTMSATVPADYADRIAGHWTCELRQTAALDALELGRLRILLVLIATGLVLIFGLAIYGIKMTHKVAGPLFKVSLYLAKMKDGRYDKVWNLRKGDQLVEFYDHFKAGHAGVVQLEKDDIVQLKTLIAAAEAAGAGDHESVTELKTLLARKEKAIE